MPPINIAKSPGTGTVCHGCYPVLVRAYLINMEIEELLAAYIRCYNYYVLGKICPDMKIGWLVTDVKLDLAS